jgi:prophage regulatory protein
MSTQFLRRPEVSRRTGLCRSSIYQQVEAGTFPQPVKLGLRAVAWVEDEVEAWLGDKIAQRDARVSR